MEVIVTCTAVQIWAIEDKMDSNPSAQPVSRWLSPDGLRQRVSLHPRLANSSAVGSRPDQGLLVSDIFVVHVASLRQTFYFARQNLAGFFHSFSPMSPGRTFTIWSGRWESNPHPFPAKALKSLVETKQSVAPH
jgi:hypothetical protein